MTPGEFKSEWEKVSDPTVSLDPYTKGQLAGHKLKPETAKFLVEAGLPDSPEPFFLFMETEEDTMKSLSGTYGFGDEHKHYKLIGENDANPVCIDTSANDRIVCMMNGSYQTKEMLVNTSVAHLAAFLLRFAQFDLEVRAAHNVESYLDAVRPDKELNKLLQDFIAIDEPATHKDTLWFYLLNDLYFNEE